MTPSNWRERFLEIAANLRQQLGQPAQNALSDPTQPVQFAFTIDGVLFDALHAAEGEIGTHQMLLQCRMGAIEANNQSDLLQLALQANQAMARTRSGVLGLDPATQELVIGMKQSLGSLTAQDLLEGASRLASLVTLWRSRHQPHAH